MTRMRIIFKALTAAALLAATSCGTAVRTGSAPVFLSIDNLSATRGRASAGQPSSTLSSDVLTIVTSGGLCTVASPCPTIFSDSGTATLRIVPKNVISGTAPSTNNEVTISRIHVDYRRTDGRNAQGTDVPFSFDTFATLTVPVNGAVNLGFELVRIQAKQESPLVQLVSNGQTIAAVAELTFYGQDRSGNAVSATGVIQVQFSDFGD